MEHKDDFEEYNYDESLHTSGHARKGKTKKEAGQNKNPVEHGRGHAERNVVDNIQHGEQKRKEAPQKQQKEKEWKLAVEILLDKQFGLRMKILNGVSHAMAWS